MAPHLGREGGHLSGTRATFRLQLLPHLPRLGALLPHAAVPPRRRQRQAVALRLLRSGQLGLAGRQGGLQLSHLWGQENEGS